MVDIVIINGKEAKLLYRQSQSQQKAEPKVNTPKVLSILEELLKGDRSQAYKSGITTLTTLTTLDGLKLKDTRIANSIVELRKIIPKSGLLTFHYADGEYRYGLILDDDVIAFAEKLKTSIQDEIQKS